MYLLVVSAELCVHILLRNETTASLALLHCGEVPVNTRTVKLYNYALQRSNIGIIIIIITIIIIIIIIAQCHDRSKDTFKEGSPESALWCLRFEFPTPSCFFMVIR
jgi:hypothetical protein